MISEIFKTDKNNVNNEDYIIKNFNQIKTNIFDLIHIFSQTQNNTILNFITPQINCFLDELNISTKTNKQYNDTFMQIFANLLVSNMDQFLNELNDKKISLYINEFISIVEVDEKDLEKFIKHPKIQKEIHNTNNNDNICFYDKNILRFIDLLPNNLKSNTCVNVLFDEFLHLEKNFCKNYNSINDKFGPLYAKIKKYINNLDELNSIIEIEPEIVYLIDDVEHLKKLKTHNFKEDYVKILLEQHPILIRENILNEIKDDLKNKEHKKRRNI